MGLQLVGWSQAGGGDSRSESLPSTVRNKKSPTQQSQRHHMSHLHRQQPGRCSTLGNNTQHTFMHNKDQFAANSSRYRLLSHQLHVTYSSRSICERVGDREVRNTRCWEFCKWLVRWWHTLWWKHLDIRLSGGILYYGNVWTSFCFLCCSFCLEFPALQN